MREHGPDHLLKQVVVHLEVVVRVRVHQGRDAGNEAVVAITRAQAQLLLRINASARAASRRGGAPATLWSPVDPRRVDDERHLGLVDLLVATPQHEHAPATFASNPSGNRQRSSDKEGRSQYRFLGTTGSVRPIICDNLAAWVVDEDDEDDDVSHDTT
jgi:hypothetical protein